MREQPRAGPPSCPHQLAGCQQGSPGTCVGTSRHLSHGVSRSGLFPTDCPPAQFYPCLHVHAIPLVGPRRLRLLSGSLHLDLKQFDRVQLSLGILQPFEDERHTIPALNRRVGHIE